MAATEHSKDLRPRNEHIDACIFKLKELVRNDIFRMCTVQSADNISDRTTKVLARESVVHSMHFMLSMILASIIR